MKKRLFSALSALLVALMLLGVMACAPAVKPSATEAPTAEPQATAEPTAQPEPTTQPAAAVTVTDQAGREVTIEGEPQRIVSGYYISSSACIALGLTDRLVGIEAKAKSRPIYAMAAPALIELPNVGTAKEFDLEGCIALEPDLVILPKKLKDAAETLGGLGIPVLLVNPESHTQLVEMLSLIAAATGTQKRAEALVVYYDAALADAAKLTEGLDKPVVYMAGNSSYLSTAPKDMYQASLIEAAGGMNAAAGIEGDSWTEVSYEQLLAMQPDVIVIPAEASYTKDELLADAQLSQLPAVQNGAVYAMPTGFEAWDSPVPSGILGTGWLLSVLHEDVAPFDAFQAEVQAFYREFYGAEVDAALVTK